MASGWLTLRHTAVSLIRLLDRLLKPDFLRLGSLSAGCCGGGHSCALLGRRGDDELSGVDGHADALMADQWHHAMNLLVMLSAEVGFALVTMYLGWLSRLRRVALLTRQRGQLRHRVAIRLRLDGLHQCEVLGQLECRGRLLQRVDDASVGTLEQSEKNGSRGRDKRSADAE